MGRIVNIVGLLIYPLIVIVVMFITLLVQLFLIPIQLLAFMLIPQR